MVGSGDLLIIAAGVFVGAVIAMALVVWMLRSGNG